MSEPVPHVAIVIVEYDPRWPLLFAEERARIGAALGGLVETIERIEHIEHIGSTSVPGLAAKPIIDLLAITDDLGPPDPYIGPLASLGYTFFPALGNADRHMFGRGRPHTHHLHIVQRGGDEHARPIAFRDYLRTHPETAREYEALKRDLARRFPGDRQAYNQGKTSFIRSIEAIARG